jgi:hypothetical protein
MKKEIIAAGILAAFALFAWAIETLHDARPMLFGKRWLALIMVCLVVLMTLLTLHFARARDGGQWEASDPAIVEWYQSLMQPDVPAASCCGEADAYFCDDVHVKGDKTFCAITDDRPDEPRGRPHVEIGTEIEIPNNKLKFDRGNPTGHGVVFLSRARYVYCFVQPGV